MVQFSFHSFTGIKYNLGSYAFFTLRKFVARFKLFSVLFLPYIGDSWNPVVSYRLQSKNITWGHYGCFSGKIFAPTKGPRRNPTSLPALAAKLDKFPYTLRIYVQKTTRQETQGNIFPNVDRGHKGGILSFHWRRLARLFFDSKLTAKWWYLRSSFWREYFSPRQTSTPARHFRITAPTGVKKKKPNQGKTAWDAANLFMNLTRNIFRYVDMYKHDTKQILLDV